MTSLPQQPVLSHAGSTLNFDALVKRIGKLESTAWTALSLGAKIEAGSPAGSVRTEQGATSSRLEGLLKVKAGQKLEPGETLATIPLGFRPIAEVFLTPVITTTTGYLKVTTAGVISVSVALAETTFVALDGLTFNLT
jgi:hypothetical protein